MADHNYEKAAGVARVFDPPGNLVEATRTYKRTRITKWYSGPIKVKGGSEAAGAARNEGRP